MTWKQKAPTRCEALRALMADGGWHTHQELTKAGGARFGARLLEIRRGDDGGPPLEIVGEAVGGDDSRWRYRANPSKNSKTSRVAQAAPLPGHSGPDMSAGPSFKGERRFRDESPRVATVVETPRVVVSGFAPCPECGSVRPMTGHPHAPRWRDGVLVDCSGREVTP